MSDLVKTALVTGGSRGIGKSIVTRLALEGFQVYFTYKNSSQDAENICSELAKSKAVAKGFKLDSTDITAVKNFFKDEIKDKVELSVLVNNAGITRDGLLIRMKDENWTDVINTNLTSPFFFTQEAVKLMSKQRSGRIINISSVVAQTGAAGQANYVASKAGLIGLTKSVALEVASRNITVNAITPGFIETDMTAVLSEEISQNILKSIPLARFGVAEDISGAVAFLVGKDASYITGQVIAINGGLYM